ncbi:MAG: trigger factor [Pirellulales bacterium]|nr:trigger factor [Pirellulales bacterium]
MSNDTPELTDQPVAEDAEKERLDLNVEIEERGACERHVTVTVPREDIERYFDDAFTEMMPKADVPGFRVGRAPRKLVESRFRKEVADQVKGNLLMDSLGQVTEESNLAAISEPELDPYVIDIPEEGSLTFEFDIEVRPEFDLPDWKGLKIDRPTQEFTDAEIDDRLKDILQSHAKKVPSDEPANVGDFLTVDMTFKHDGEAINSLEEVQLAVRPSLSFRDGNIAGFGEKAKGAKVDDVITAKVKLTADAPNEELRGKQIDVEMKVLGVRKLELPEMTPAFLEKIGEFSTEEELREVVKQNLERQLDYARRATVRKQITTALVKTAQWDLPQEMLRRQADREFQRAILELRREGFSEQQVRAHANTLRQNSQAETARALKEHFILEKIAEVEGIEESPQDIDMEIALIAAQLGESPRRVRARLEKQGQMDALRNQIIERQVIDKISAEAKFNDVPYNPERPETEAVDFAAGGGDEEEEIPEAKAERESAEEQAEAGAES